MGIKNLTKLISDNTGARTRTLTRKCDHCLKRLSQGGAIKEQVLANYFGRKVAIDASMTLYQFMVRAPLVQTCNDFLLCQIAVRSGGEQLTNENGEVTRCVRQVGVALLVIEFPWQSFARAFCSHNQLS